MIGAASTVFVILMLGIGSQYLPLFQQPYSLEAQSETSVELVDLPIVQHVDTKPNVRNQLVGRSDRDGKNDGSGNEANQVLGNDGDDAQWNLPKGAENPSRKRQHKRHKFFTRWHSNCCRKCYRCLDL